MRFGLLMILIISVITYVQWNLYKRNPNFYAGKDGGLFCMLESVLFLGAVFFALMATRKQLLFLFLGFFVSLIGTIVVYLILGFSHLYTKLLLHVLSCLAFVTLFFYIEKLMLKNKATSKKG